MEEIKATVATKPVKVVSYLRFPEYTDTQIIEFPSKPPTETDIDYCPICNKRVYKAGMDDHLNQCAGDLL